MSACTHACVCMSMWRSALMWQSVVVSYLFLLCGAHLNQTGVVSLGGEWLYILSHLACPSGNLCSRKMNGSYQRKEGGCAGFFLFTKDYLSLGQKIGLRVKSFLLKMVIPWERFPVPCEIHMLLSCQDFVNMLLPLGDLPDCPKQTHSCCPPLPVQQEQSSVPTCLVTSHRHTLKRWVLLLPLTLIAKAAIPKNHKLGVLIVVTYPFTGWSLKV